MPGFKYQKDADQLVTITMDMTGPANTMMADFRVLLSETVMRLEEERDHITGVIITSAKDTFFAGGNSKEFVPINKGEEEKLFQEGMQMKSFMRRLEHLGKPVVAAINGSALGGGYEICLACHHRIAINDPKIRIGLPDVNLGLLPGAGGIVRLISKLGLEKALPFLLEGKQLTPEKALEAGLIEEVAEGGKDMMKKAVTWIKANPAATQPWDRNGYTVPGGNARNPKVIQILQITPAMLQKNTQGLVPAPEVILDVAANVLRVDFDTALKIESRGFVKLMLSTEAKNMISTLEA